MERGLLSDKQLARHYDDVVWLYLFQDFSGGEADRAAERVAIRFGVSSWPQHLLIDPLDLEVLGSTGRDLDSFGRAVAAARVTGTLAPTQAELERFDALASAVRSAEGLELAKQHVLHPDRVVRYRAVERLAEAQPEVVLDHARPLLAIEHDQLRYAVCKVLGERGDERHARALDALVADPGEGSRNPNVVRIRAVAALARCGDGATLEVLAPFAIEGAANNGLTRTTLTTVGAIGARVEDARERAAAILVASLPELAPADGERTERIRRLQASIALHAHEELERLSGVQAPFPDEYDEESRAGLVAAWRARLE